MKAAEELKRFEALWRTGTMLERKRLLQAYLTAVLIQGETIEAVQPSLVSYPLFQHQESQCRNYGSDGGQTRCVYISMRGTYQPTGWFFRSAPHCKVIAVPEACRSVAPPHHCGRSVSP
jgi:hypothetical protein